ncbi:MAG: hypothetical protein UX04_C0002G0013 [Microgenomates group bacterium GW2011_GWF2_45_18]|nr:MAG: hypothetical protein UW18_C0001G0084 [Microgenomates group bacterium GW2011_GWF1_44_10]KKU01870.1 MAG: hypothetical protein UX04_C0002G0013 [Microgenomates group bacterium GW2011_GWF2_45_18]OGJ41115.1 MAG: hypothetical protein A2378_04515 [Candidatus Pacebacteria bacterium RIFOXYB1_FULL_44_10]HAU98813.1 hypothetical protein [Candidatus Paceibacterota bacterium]HAX01367.1 hypothetical protein [Candidatus Paceibacterota bacterium]
MKTLISRTISQEKIPVLILSQQDNLVAPLLANQITKQFSEYVGVFLHEQTLGSFIRTIEVPPYLLVCVDFVLERVIQNVVREFGCPIIYVFSKEGMNKPENVFPIILRGNVYDAGVIQSCAEFIIRERGVQKETILVGGGEEIVRSTHSIVAPSKKNITLAEDEVVEEDSSEKGLVEEDGDKKGLGGAENPLVTHTPFKHAEKSYLVSPTPPRIPAFSHVPVEHPILLDSNESSSIHSEQKTVLQSILQKGDGVGQQTNSGMQFSFQESTRVQKLEESTFEPPPIISTKKKRFRVRTPFEKMRALFLSVLGGVLLVHVGLLLLFYLVSERSIRWIQQLQSSSTEGVTYVVTKQNVALLQSSISMVGWYADYLRRISVFVGQDAWIEDRSRSMRFAEEIARVYAGSASASLDAGSLFLSILFPNVVQQGGVQQNIDALQSLQTTLDSVSKDSSIFLSELTQYQSSHGSIPLLAKEIAKLRKMTYTTSHILSVLPSMLGKNEKRTYLVVLQNPMELRPTGGFIQGVMMVVVEKGKVLDIQYFDTYALDEQLQGKVEPPADLTQFLKESQWYLRDANWSPDFPSSATKISWFFEKEMGVVVDGVIAINAHAVLPLLDLVQGVSLPSFNNETVEAENFMQRLVDRTEVNFRLEGSTKQDYFSETMKQIVQKMKSLDNVQASQLLSKILLSLEESQMYLYSKNPVEQEVLRSIGWDGGVLTPLCPQQFTEQMCIVDTSYVVEANVGVNKANESIKRTGTHVIFIHPNEIVHTHTLELENLSYSTAWPRGIYKTYVRMYVPPTATHSAILLNGEPLSASATYETVEQGKKVLGAYLEVPIQSTKALSFSYTIPAKEMESSAQSSGVFSYAFFMQKQAGVAQYPQSISIRIEPSTHLKKIAPEGTVIPNGVEFFSTMRTHQFVAVEVSR